MAKKSSVGETYRLMDPSKAVAGCDGYFEPESRQPHGALRPGKTNEDRMRKEDRPRYQRWLKRLGR